MRAVANVGITLRVEGRGDRVRATMSGAAPVFKAAEQALDAEALRRDVAALGRALERALHARTSPTDDCEVAHLGRVVFERALPEPIRAALRTTDGGSLEIESDLELPWEASHDGRGFLGLRFALGERRPGDLPSGRGAPPAGRVAVVGDPAGDLPAARHEAEALVRAFSDGVEPVSADARFGRLRRAEFPRLCRGAFGLHYAGHADIGRGLRLADGHLDATALAGLGPNGGPTVVFLNACGGLPLGTRGDQGLSDVAVAPDAGVFRALVQAGAHHVIGPWLDVPDLPSADLARDFWAWLRRGASTGEALRRARVAAAERGEAVALAHRLFGAPAVCWYAPRASEGTSAGARAGAALAVRCDAPPLLGPEGLASVQQARRALLKRIIESHGGRLLPGRGAVDRAVFGVPTSFENDVQRAARALAEVRDALDPDARLVLEAGPLVQAGADVVGACALAAESACWRAAPGAWLLPNAARALGHRDCVAGSEALVPLSALDTQSRAQWTSVAEGPVFGRDAERRVVAQTLDEALALRGARALLVTGPAGIGKSRLVEQSELAREGLRIVRGQARPYDESQPFAAAADVLLALLGLREDAPAHARQAALRALIQRHAASSAGALPAAGIASIDALLAASAPALGSGSLVRAPTLTPADAAALAPILGVRHTERAATDEVEAGLVPAALARVLAAAATEGPLCVVLEDLHWLPPAGLATLDALLTEVAARAAGARGLPLVVVATCRPDLPAAVSGWFEAAAARRVDLGPLDAEATRRLLASLAPETDPAVAERLLARAEGNPLFVRELALEQSRSAEQGAREATTVPQSVEAILRARIDRQRPFEREVLHAAAVVGRTFWREAVERLLGAPTGIAAALDDLAARRFIVRRAASEVGGAEAWQFAHALVHEVVYAGVAERTRTTWHSRAALWLRHESGTGAWASRIAAHHLGAGELGWAARAHAEAGQAALEAHAPLEARAAFDAALAAQSRAAAAGDPQALDEGALGALEAAQAGLLNRLGELPEAARLFDLAIEHAHEDSARADRLRRRALVDAARGEREAARGRLQAAERALAESTAPATALLRLRVRHDHAWLAHRDGDYAGARAGLAETLAALDSAAPGLGEAVRPDADELRGELHNHLGVVAWSLGEYAIAADHYTRALAAYDACGAAQATAAVFNNLGILAQKQGDFDGASRWLERGLEIKLARGDRAGLARLYNNLGTLAGEQGDFTRARDFLLESVRIKQRLGDGALAVSCANLGEAYLRLGDGERARPWLDQAVTMCADGLGPKYLLPDVWRMRAELELQSQAPDAAHAAATRACAFAVESGDRPREAAALRVLAEAAQRLGDVSGALRAVEAALDRLEGIDQPLERARVVTLRAALLGSPA